MGRSYDYEMKQFVAKMIVEEGKKAAEVSREMDIPYGTLSRWVSDYRKKQAQQAEGLDYITPSEHKKREKELLDRIKDLEEENAIIKKAVHIFAKNPK
jgi:transposase